MHIWIYFVASRDYENTTRLLTFEPGVTQQEVGVVILEDGVFERDEEFVVALSVPMGETSVEVRQGMATITIEDNDGKSLC